VQQPATSLRSGGPGSLIPWDTLGWQGRNFTGKGPTAGDIGAFTGHPAMEPIRIYAGLASADGPDTQAALAVRDLQRAGGFQRKNLVVVTTTGSGWVDPALVDTFEYLSNGDCATAAIQYSYLPSWISYLVDQSKALAAGRALFVGPPNFNTLFRAFSDHRDPGQSGDPAHVPGRSDRPVQQRPGQGHPAGR